MDLPWLGQLFSSTRQERNEVELMIVLVPRILDSTWITEEMQRGDTSPGAPQEGLSL